jgi:2,4-dienoyl-CoA reductase-like NADH-dependent reductase (Old Yellow Enzyme family)
MMENQLFQPIKLKNIVLKNRFIMSATNDNLAEKNGYISQQQIDRMIALAQGEVALITLGSVSVDATGRTHPDLLSLHDDHALPGLEKLVNAVHQHGGKIAVQLTHLGVWAAGLQNSLGKKALAPSLLLENNYYHSRPYFSAGQYHAMSGSEIEHVITAFGQAAKRAQQVGFDMVQIDAARDSLLSQFLSPHTNKREDQWGGSLQGRCKIHFDVINAIKSEVGNSFPLSIKLGMQDGFVGGLMFSEGKELAIKLAQNGDLDGLEVSQGLQGHNWDETVLKININTQQDEGYFHAWTQTIKNDTKNVAIIMNGGLRSYTYMEEIIKNNVADLIALCRPLIKQPALIKMWKEKSSSRSECTSCNNCILALMQGLPFDCYLDKVFLN